MRDAVFDHPRARGRAVPAEVDVPGPAVGVPAGLVAGKAGGQFFAGKGAKNVLCVNTLPGAANTEARCKGIADGIAKHGGASDELPSG